MKILLLGKDGQVGHELKRTLLPLGDVHAFGRQGANLENLEALRQLLAQQAPDIIVNAAAYTAVDKAETNQDVARTVNADAVAEIARYAKANDALFVHYSTDYVFDGRKEAPYDVDDQTNPQSVYGSTKLAGEAAITASGCKALILRTSWVFSAHGGNFIKTILRLAKERDALNIVADQHGAPTSAELIADVTALAVAGFQQGKLAAGIYHLTAAGHTTWHGLATHVVARARHNGLALKVQPDNIGAITTEQYPVPAARPKNSRLNTNALTAPLKLQLPDWTVHVDRTVDQLTSLELSA
ncbi:MULTISPECIES: dTDP-4-dehydrorhamnose reductase [Achromobacter]|uniref:dTDP-4-dehydrorhamnose reductase n=1 Tax=Achromobacter piechaudii TaxID=72556 RepID=A0A6S7DNM8_9BURK|nr:MULTISPECIES: dTDP-4-dehydrorhamnose reductase [Achromobacter]MPS82062.1 dTDP-4-dehydrorhamnose reductase [Achromobacter sp.]CAB3840986.1 dTDP-4-dehydrorhamnose reductase [Achromobacter piechaudii]